MRRASSAERRDVVIPSSTSIVYDDVISNCASPSNSTPFPSSGDDVTMAHLDRGVMDIVVCFLLCPPFALGPNENTTTNTHSNGRNFLNFAVCSRTCLAACERASLQLQARSFLRPHNTIRCGGGGSAEDDLALVVTPQSLAAEKLQEKNLKVLKSYVRKVARQKAWQVKVYEAILVGTEYPPQEHTSEGGGAVPEEDRFGPTHMHSAGRLSIQCTSQCIPDIGHTYQKGIQPAGIGSGDQGLVKLHRRQLHPPASAHHGTATRVLPHISRPRLEGIRSVSFSDTPTAEHENPRNVTNSQPHETRERQTSTWPFVFIVLAGSTSFDSVHERDVVIPSTTTIVYDDAITNCSTSFPSSGDHVTIQAHLDRVLPPGVLDIVVCFLLCPPFALGPNENTTTNTHSNGRNFLNFAVCSRTCLAACERASLQLQARSFLRPHNTIRCGGGGSAEDDLALVVTPQSLAAEKLQEKNLKVLKSYVRKVARQKAWQVKVYEAILVGTEYPPQEHISEGGVVVSEECRFEAHAYAFGWKIKHTGVGEYELKGVLWFYPLCSLSRRERVFVFCSGSVTETYTPYTFKSGLVDVWYCVVNSGCIPRGTPETDPQVWIQVARKNTYIPWRPYRDGDLLKDEAGTCATSPGPDLLNLCRLAGFPSDRCVQCLECIVKCTECEQLTTP
ncbi:hypothetical protein Pelo_16900 [Pelomyxa schiedti]|nr:hypothetical protein Pelo_16900 [Pelomyxa schiedti]